MEKRVLNFPISYQKLSCRAFPVSLGNICKLFMCNVVKIYVTRFVSRISSEWQTTMDTLS